MIAGNMMTLIYKLIKFCVVGFSGMIIDFGITWICKEKLRINKYVSNSIGFILAASSNYIWNRLWTFESKDSGITKEYASFLIVSTIGLALNNLCLYLFTDKLKINFYISKVMAIAIVTLWNFFMNYYFTFNV